MPGAESFVIAEHAAHVERVSSPQATGSPANAVQTVRVFLVCPGLGHVIRGYETFTRECFEALRHDPNLDLVLYKGAGPASDGDRTAFCLKRNGALAKALGMAFRDGYYWEQTSFGLSLIPAVVRHKPDVVYFSDGVVGNILWRWRRLTGARFKLLLSNGGPLGPPDFPRWDHVHQVSSVFYEESAQAGRPSETQTLLPYGFNVATTFTPPTIEEKVRIRRELCLPVDRPVILSVGAFNASHKRMDYLIREVAALPAPRPYVIVLGQRDAESPAMEALAREMLGIDGFECRTVAFGEVPQYHRSADVFVLASRKEGFSRAMGEASLAGLRCIAADRGHARFALGDVGTYGDFEIAGTLTRLLSQALARPDDPAEAIRRHAVQFERLSWDRLAAKYVDMIVRCAGVPRAATARSAAP
jgi:1,2-diacylglycerol 3-alpha-glucosyltransferase